MNFLFALALIAQPPVDKVAHFGISWAVNHSVYAICEKVVENETGCLIGSIATTAAIGVAKEIADGNNNTGSEHAKDLAADAAGIALSTLMITITW